MSVYTVHEPPLRVADASADPRRFIFVRDGFYLWAFLLTPLWMLWHRLWLVLALYLVISIGIEALLDVLGASGWMIVLAGILISLLAALEAGTLRRFTLRRRRWRNVGLVGGDRLEDAELRFFDAWLRQPAARDSPSTSKPAPPLVTPPPSSPEAPGVIGLFPEPGAKP